jgi:hypothetical protein
MKLMRLCLSLSPCRVLWKLIPFFCLSVFCLILNLASLCPVSCSSLTLASPMHHISYLLEGI